MDGHAVSYEWVKGSGGWSEGGEGGVERAWGGQRTERRAEQGEGPAIWWVGVGESRIVESRERVCALLLTRRIRSAKIRYDTRHELTTFTLTYSSFRACRWMEVDGAPSFLTCDHRGTGSPGARSGVLTTFFPRVDQYEPTHLWGEKSFRLEAASRAEIYAEERKRLDNFLFSLPRPSCVNFLDSWCGLPTGSIYYLTVER